MASIGDLVTRCPMVSCLFQGPVAAGSCYSQKENYFLKPSFAHKSESPSLLMLPLRPAIGPGHLLPHRCPWSRESLATAPTAPHPDQRKGFSWLSSPSGPEAAHITRLRSSPWHLRWNASVFLNLLFTNYQSQHYAISRFPQYQMSQLAHISPSIIFSLTNFPDSVNKNPARSFWHGFTFCIFVTLECPNSFTFTIYNDFLRLVIAHWF